MFATYKSSAVRYMVYVGIAEEYPKWFRNEIAEHTYVDEFGFSFYGLDSLVEGYDVFMMNKRGDIRRTNIDAFEESFIPINDSIAVPHQGVRLEYCLFDGFDPDLPDWVMDMFFEGIISSEYGTYYFYDEQGQVPMDPKFVVLRNEYGDVRWIEQYNFIDKFYTMLNP